MAITSEVFGDDDFYDSEKHYLFSRSQTEELFSLISPEELIDSCKKGGLGWLERFLDERGIVPRTNTF